MLNKTLLKEVQQRLDGCNSSVQDVRDRLYKKIDFDNIIDCDDCGCLLIKKAQFKQPSTVEIQETSSAGMAGIYGNYGYGHSGPVVPNVIERKEVIKEHYKCIRCQNSTIVKAEKSK